MTAILKKELRTYFLTPTGWIFMAVFLIVAGILFAISNVFRQNPEYAGLIASLVFIFLLVVPLLTMKTFAEERRLRTDQLLLTGPASLWSIVMGKYLAAVLVFFLTILITMAYPLMLAGHGNLEWAKIMGTYIGFLLLGMSFISLGIWVSSLTESIAGAAVLTFLALMITFIVDFMRPHMPAGEVAGLAWVGLLAALMAFWVYRSSQNWLAGGITAVFFALVLGILWFTMKEQVFLELMGKSFSWISLTERFNSFPLGLLKLDAVVYYLSFSAFFLFVTVQGLEKRRWS